MSTAEQQGIGNNLQGTVLALLATLGVAAALLLAPILPQIIAAFPDDPNAELKVILALAAPSLVVAFTAPFIGRVVERFGRKPVLVTALTLYLCCGTAPFFLDTLEAIILTRLGVGLGEAGVMTASTTLIGDYFKGERRERWLVVQTGVAAISAVFFSLVAGSLGELGWRFPFLVYAMPLFYIPFVIFGMPEPKPEASSGSSGSWNDFPWRRVLPLYAIGLPAALLFFVVPIQTPFLLTERGFGSPQLIGQVAAIGGIGVTAGGFLFKSLDRLSLFQNLTIAFVLIASGLGIFAGADSYLLTVVGVIVASLGCGMTLPAILTSLMNALSFNERGRGTGGWQTVFFVGNFLSPISVLAATALLGGLETALLALAVLSGAGAVLCLLASRPARGGGEARMVAADE